MRKQLLAVLLALAPLGVWAQEVKLPAEIKGKPGEFVVISATTTDPQVKWFGIDAGLNLFPAQLLKDSKTAVVTALVPGRYRVLAVSAKGDMPSEFAECLVVIGDAPPVVVIPVPPGPDPTPPPAPVSGPRGVLLVRESAAQSSKLADLVRDLRNPTTVEFKYLKEHGHSFYVFDPDQLGDAKTRWGLAELPLPVVVIYDKDLKALIKQSIPADTSNPTVVLDLVKKSGG